jgi:pimeloyl-ACP methyl ester carboxylesterase
VSIADHAADAAALLDHLRLARAHVAGHSSGAAVAAQLALDHPESVHTLILLELALLSVPSGEGFLEQAGPAFAAHADGDHSGALAMFMSGVSCLDWTTCRARSRSVFPAWRRRRSEMPTPFSASSCPRLRNA